jgi:hypothetical protein
MDIENENVRLRNKDRKQEEQLIRLDKEIGELKLYIHISDLIRKAIGI